MGAVVEVEAKFEVDERFALPELVGIAGVAAVSPVEVQQSTAMYYDTPDLRLTSSGVTLRRRSGGSDPGWHVKVPIKKDRLEIQRPAGRTTRVVPAEVARLVRARTLGEGLVPVAEVSTQRAV